MKCSCGAELPAGARFCSFCGKSVSETPEKRFCQYCGKELYPGAAFCGKCGKQVVAAPASAPAAPPAKARPEKKKSAPGTCPACGAVLYPGAAFCGKCRTPVAASPSRAPASSAIGSVREKLKPAQTWVESKISNRERAKRLLIILLVIGLCMVSTGLCGRVVFGRVISEVKNSPIIQSAGSPVVMVLNNAASRDMISLMVSVIRNDPSGFVSAVNRIASATASIAGIGSGYTDIVEYIAGSTALEAFNEARTSLKESAGGWWPLLVIMAYYKEFLIIGIILAVSAAVLWFLLGGSFRDFKALNMMPAAWIGAGWITLMFIAGIAASIWLHNMAQKL